MIEAEVERGGETIITRTYQGTGLTLEVVAERVRDYIVQEQLNTEGECTVRTRFK